MKRIACLRTVRRGPLLRPHSLRARVKYRSVSGIRSICFFITLLTLSHSAQAADHGQLGPTSPEIKAWANSLDNTLGEVCCSTADGWKPEEVEYEMKDNKYRVKIDGEWYDVPPYAVIKRPNIRLVL